MALIVHKSYAILESRRGEAVFNQTRAPGVANEDSNESREWQQPCEHSLATTSGNGTKQQGLVSTLKASEMIQELSQESSRSNDSQHQAPESPLTLKLQKLEAILEMMLAKVCEARFVEMS